jgi:hypothetical protein
MTMPQAIYSRSAIISMVVLLVFSAGSICRAQPAPTNAEVYQELAVRCLGTAIDADSLILESPARMPYLRGGLVEAWKQRDIGVFERDNLRLPRVWYTIEHATVTYRRANRREWSRHVDLGLRYSITTPDGRVVSENSCRQHKHDIIPAAERLRLESPAHPETQAVAPAPGFVRRYVEPAVLIGATAVTTWLFFNLRSRSSSGDQ